MNGSGRPRLRSLRLVAGAFLVLAFTALCAGGGTGTAALAPAPAGGAAGAAPAPEAAPGPVATPAPTVTDVPALAPTVSPTTGRATGSTGRAVPPARPHPRDDADTQRRIEHCQSRGPAVWLTFDDGGSAAQVHRILRVLREQNVRAIFFPIGSWARAHPDLVRQIGRAGHLVGDHTYSHVDLAKLPPAAARNQILRGLTDGPGAVPLVRPPFGAGAYTRRLHAIAQATGVRLCTWTVDTRDWTGLSARTIVRKVAHGDALTPPVRKGGVIIMHMNGDHTGQALPGVIRAVRARHLPLHRLR